MNLLAFRGPVQFGPAYHYMYQNDSHALGSVDRVLLDNMILLCSDTEAYLYSEFTPLEIQYRKGSRPVLEAYLQQVVAGCASSEQRVTAIARFAASLGEQTQDDLDAMLLGGTEEAIIRRGSDWCTDLARVGCVLSQVAGFPARIAVLADTDNAYSGHVITEVYRNGAWGAVDHTNGVVYADEKGQPLSAAAVRETGHTQFRTVALANYFVWEAGTYSYTISGINGYYRSILTMSQQGWPGGLRWLHDEERTEA